MRILLIVLMAACSVVHGQEKKAAPVVTMIQPEAFEFAPEDRAKIREAQVAWDQLEIENQKALVKIEQNKAKQTELMAQIKTIAFTTAQQKNVNLNVYELDLATVRLVKKLKP